MAKFKSQLEDMYLDESLDEYYDRKYGKGTKERKSKPTFGDDTGKGMGGSGIYKRGKKGVPFAFGMTTESYTSPGRAEAADAPVRRAEERIRREIAEEEAARKAGKPIKKIYQKGGTVEDKRSERTKRIEETKIEDDFMGIKKLMKAGALKASQLGDKVGFTQEEEYKDKKPVKKKSGGMIKSSASKRADGIATKGKTKGRMV
jgi:hypothetical protein